MTDITSSTCPVQQRLATIRASFVCHEAYNNLSDLFQRMIQQRRYELSVGNSAEARGIVVVGASGSGKTTAIEHLIRNHIPEQTVVDDIPVAEVVSLRVPSPATVKHVGITTLHALGYPIAREPSGAIIWGNVKTRLKLRQTLFVHFDEAQDFFSNQNGRELQAVINTVKSLMQDKEWPVSIILSGMPVLVDLINKDPQLSRRVRPVYIPEISVQTDGAEIVHLLRQYSRLAGLVLFDGHDDPDFLRRLVKAAGEQFGLTIELVIAAIEDALYLQSDRLDQPNFARSFRLRTGCLDGRNPFLAEDFRTFQTLKILDDLAVKK